MDDPEICVKTNMTRGTNVNIMMHNDILLSSKVGAQFSSHQGGFIQQLVDTDAETHS